MVAIVRSNVNWTIIFEDFARIASRAVRGLTGGNFHLSEIVAVQDLVSRPAPSLEGLADASVAKAISDRMDTFGIMSMELIDAYRC